MFAMGPGFFRKITAGGGGGQTITFIGFTAPNTTNTGISVPSGAAAGDLLVMCITNGTNNATISPPAGWTSVSQTSYGTICTRTMQVGDSTFTLSGNALGMIAARGSVSTPVVDAFSASTPLTTSGTIVAASVTPTTSSDLALVFFSGRGGGMSTYTGTATVNFNMNIAAYGTCSMAIANQTLASTSPYSGGSVVYSGASASFPAGAHAVLLK